MEIAIIKLGELGDVIRTLPLAAAIKKKYPNSNLTWVTKKESAEIIKTDKYIDRVLTSLPEEADIVYNFDIDDNATKMVSEITAKEKYGFYSENGYTCAFNLGAEYYLNTLFDDELKKSNKKTYQEMMFKAAEIPYGEDNYSINLNEKEIEFGKSFIRENDLSGKKIIGIHMGASSRWPSKAWAEEKVREFIIKTKRTGKEVILFGGPNEKEKHQKLISDLKSEGVKILCNNPNNTTREFASLVNICDVIVCSDTLALHIAVGLNKKTIGLFFCTSPEEVKSYGLITKIASPMLYQFFPEKMDQYSAELTNSISVEEVMRSMEERN